MKKTLFKIFSCLCIIFLSLEDFNCAFALDFALSPRLITEAGESKNKEAIRVIMASVEERRRIAALTGQLQTEAYALIVQQIKDIRARRKRLMREFGALIKEKRNALGITQAHLGAKIRTASRYLSHIETGTYGPSERVCFMLAQELEIDKSILIKFYNDIKKLKDDIIKLRNKLKFREGTVSDAWVEKNYKVGLLPGGQFWRDVRTNGANEFLERANKKVQTGYSLLESPYSPGYDQQQDPYFYLAAVIDNQEIEMDDMKPQNIAIKPISLQEMTTMAHNIKRFIDQAREGGAMPDLTQIKLYPVFVIRAGALTINLFNCQRLAEILGVTVEDLKWPHTANISNIIEPEKFVRIQVETPAEDNIRESSRPLVLVSELMDLLEFLRVEGMDGQTYNSIEAIVMGKRRDLMLSLMLSHLLLQSQIPDVML